MRWLAVVVVLAYMGCDSPTGLSRPPGAIQLGLNPNYITWFEEVEACTGLSGDVSRIRWFYVPGAEWQSTASGEMVAGEWWPPHDIYLAETYLSDRGAVMHEALHDLLQAPGHPEPPFGSCAPRYVIRP